MSRSIRIYSFGDVDRSGKVRWTACELGYEIEEERVALGDHVDPEYRELNPYAQIPTVILDGETRIESTAICILLAERHPEAGLIPADPERRVDFWQLLNLTATSLETPAVSYILAKRGIADERWIELVGKPLGRRLQTFAASLPDDGFLCGEFSLADICAAYVLRLALQSDLLSYDGTLAAYVDRLRARPAAVESRIFDSLQI